MWDWFRLFLEVAIHLYSLIHGHQKGDLHRPPSYNRRQYIPSCCGIQRQQMIPGCPYKGLYPSLSCVCLSPCVCLLHSPQGHFLFFVGLGNLFPSGPSPLWKNSGMVFSCSFSDMASLPSQNKNLILVLFCSLSQTGTFLYPKPFRDGLPCPATSLLRQFAISRLEDGGFFSFKTPVTSRGYCLPAWILRSYVLVRSLIGEIANGICCCFQESSGWCYSLFEMLFKVSPQWVCRFFFSVPRGASADA